MFIAYVTLAGLGVGSFLNVAVDRLPRGESIVSLPSHCPHCRRRIAFYDLIPLANYLWLRGRCRYCRASIPLRLPLVEALTGALFCWAAFRFGLSPVTLVVLLNVCVFLAIFFMDLEYRVILNKVIFPALPVLLALYPFGSLGGSQSLLGAYASALAGAAVGFGTLLVIFLVSRGGIGEGDVKMSALMGVATGLPTVGAALFFAFVSGGITALVLILTRRKGRKDYMPYGPFLAGGAILTLLTQDSLYAWYLALLSRGLG